MSYNFKQDFRKGRVPNLITLMGITTLPAIINFHQKGLFIPPLIFFAISWFCDWADGKWARTFGAQSKIGDFFDPLADKIFTWTLLIYFVVRLPLLMISAIIGFGVFATLGRIVILKAGKELNVPTNVMANRAGKFKTNFEKAGLYLLLLADLSWEYFPNGETAEVLEVLALVGLWGSIPLAIISFWQLARKLTALWKLRNEPS